MTGSDPRRNPATTSDEAIKAAIDAAPHEEWCDRYHGWTGTCECWKSTVVAALIAQSSSGPPF